MPHTPDHSVRDLSVSRPRLRRDLRFTFQDLRGRPSYILEDLTHRRYFQIGLAEYQFLRGMDGRRTASELLARNARDIGERALSEPEASVILRWLVEQKLLETESADQSDRRYRSAAERTAPQKQPLLQQLLFLKFPVGNPDRLLGQWLPWLQWATGSVFFLIWVVLLACAAYVLAQNWQPFVQSTTTAVLPQNWFYLGLSYVTLKLIHEVWHGIFAKGHGAVVPEWGVQLLLFVTPMTYVDASGSWRFASRWQRIQVAAAGMYIELFLAALAVFVWVNTGPGIANTVAYNTIFAASTITVLFNANPLMRFDGYYILSDLLRIPNLAAKGQQFVQWLGRKLLFGIRDQPPPAYLAQPLAIGTYGVLAFIWRWVVWIGIMTAVALLFKGAGIILAAFSVAGILLTGFAKSCSFLFTGNGGPRPHLGRALLRLTLIGASVIAAGWFIQISPSPKAPAVMEFAGKAILRVRCPGFVEEVRCANGQAVVAGQILAVLANPVKLAELGQIKLDIQHSELRRRSYFEEERLSAYQAESEHLRSLQEKLATTQELIDSMTFRAPVDGRVFGVDLPSLKGRYLQPGTAVLTVLPVSAPTVLISVAQKHRAILDTHRGQPVVLRLRGQSGTWRATLDRPEASATTAVPHLALLSTGGGPLPVRGRPQLATDRETGLARERSGDSELSHFAGLERESEALASQELTEARFAAHAVLQAQDGLPQQLCEGVWGYVKLANVAEERLGVWLCEKIVVYLTNRWEEVTGER
ncbi:MAG: putative peptide zinc metalloprotease protein [Verrucomicrobia bacterium]|jgi:putative peptide zinc metalloprotease protein|nr:MAG: putative peptide zinc metalloprotease protein [Verrucomicrobiota bacterium]